MSLGPTKPQKAPQAPAAATVAKTEAVPAVKTDVVPAAKIEVVPAAKTDPAGTAKVLSMPVVKTDGPRRPAWVVDPKEPNAFTSAPPVQQAPPADPLNAFTKVPGTPPMMGQGMPYPPMMGQGMPYPPMMGQGMPYPPMMGQRMQYPPVMGQAPYPIQQMPMQSAHMDQGVPSGMGNAFTDAGTARPIPADFGSPNMQGNAFLNPGEEMPATAPMPRQAMASGYPQMRGPAPMMLPAIAARSYPVPDPALRLTMAALASAPYPSHREMAAEQLAAIDWRCQPVVLEALVASAKNDPAATVRAGCVRALVKMKANTPEVVAAIRSLKDDKDEHVRQEVAQVLPSLGVTPLTGDSTVRPVGATQTVP